MLIVEHIAKKKAKASFLRAPTFERLLSTSISITMADKEVPFNFSINDIPMPSLKSYKTKFYTFRYLTHILFTLQVKLCRFVAISSYN